MHVLDRNLLGADQSRLWEFAQHACNTKAAVEQTFLLSRYLLRQRVPGCFVECGVAAGAMLAAMALAMTRDQDLRPIHAFDSFQGIPLAGPHDDLQPGIGTITTDQSLPLEKRLVSSGITVIDLTSAQKLYQAWKLTAEVHWHAGWFQHTLPGVRVGPIAFLRLDGDLYESTECCLKWLYDDVSTGGIIFVDDYGYKGCRAAVQEFFQARRIAPELLFDPDPIPEHSLGAHYWIK